MSTKEQEIYREFYAKYKSKMSDDATEIAKIVENNFDQVAQTTTSYGASQKLIVRLWDDQKSVSSGASSTVPATNSPEIKLDYLKSITVEDFRGFQAKQSFEFGRRFTFIYGRNGTGKTSLTNAIEYALLNEIQDAKYARIPETNYITNVYTKKYRIPELIGVTQDNQARTVRYDAQKYRFAIIERNRIENFSRMSAETPAIQTERLATLVGLDGWNVFFKRFGKSIHTQLEFEESIQPKVEAQKGALEKLQVSLKKFLNSSSSLSKEVDHLKVEYQVDTVEALEKKLDDHSKKLAKKITNLTPENLISLTNIELLRKAQEGVLIDLEKLLKYRDELTSYKEQLDLSDLAEALIKIQPIQRSQDEICPACQSILYDAQGNLIVPVDPFDHAGEVLSKFESAKKLEAKLKHEQATVTSAVGNINRLIDAVSVDISHEGLSFSDSDKKSLLTRKLQKEVLLGAGFKITKDEQIGVSDELIQTITTVITAYNETQEKNRTALSEANTEKLSIDASITKVKDWKSSNAVTKDQETGLKTQIFDEKEAYDNLCKKQAQLDERNKQRKVKEDAYAEFYNFLKQFTAELPVQELTGLSSQVLSLYNLINRYDSQSEQLDGLEIPANSKGNILVRPKVADASYANALDVLSEGHIRSLGLAILLAKAIQTEQKFIIFDDVVNSIDNDHRKAIAQIITSNDKPFADIQWIVTTHGQQFQKQLSSYVSKDELDANGREITFTDKDANSEIYAFEKKQNYLQLAEECLKAEDLRGCLSNCRRELEVIMMKVWSLYKDRYDNKVSFQMDPDRPVPGTNNVLTSISAKLRKNLKQNPHEAALISEFTKLLDELIQNHYLMDIMNKGTHEEENGEEFERSSVEELLNKYLEPLDTMLTDKITVKQHSFVLKEKPAS